MWFRNELSSLAEVSLYVSEYKRPSEGNYLAALGYIEREVANHLAPELFFLILAHPVYKMRIIQEPNKLALWNKLHFEEKKTESIERV